MLGLNQTIMFALSMLVITALVGTRDLGQEVYIALTKADTGRGLVAGLAVAFIAIIADRLIRLARANAGARLGLAAGACMSLDADPQPALLDRATIDRRAADRRPVATRAGWSPMTRARHVVRFGKDYPVPPRDRASAR